MGAGKSKSKVIPEIKGVENNKDLSNINNPLVTCLPISQSGQTVAIETTKRLNNSAIVPSTMQKPAIQQKITKSYKTVLESQKPTKSYPDMSSCDHKFIRKMVNGFMCSNCGIADMKNIPKAFKSEIFTSKIHFNVEVLDQMFEDQKHNDIIDNPDLLRYRRSLFKYLKFLSKEMDLSREAYHLSCSILDKYVQNFKPICKKKGYYFSAACCLYLSAKAIELDDKIPSMTKFIEISKLDFDTYTISKHEFQICGAIDWNFLTLTFYDYAVHFLNKGILVYDDEVLKCVLFDKKLDFGDWILDEEPSNQQILDHIKQLNSSSTVPNNNEKENNVQRNRSRSGSGGMVLKKKNIKIGMLKKDVQNLLSVLFENIVMTICEQIQIGCHIWRFNKATIAISAILMAKSYICEKDRLWNERLMAVSQCDYKEVEECFLMIYEILILGKERNRFMKKIAECNEFVLRSVKGKERAGSLRI